MNSSIFIKNLVKTLKGYTTDHIIDLYFATLVLSDTDNSIYWNWAFVDKNLTKEEFKKIENNLKKHNRSLALYFEDSPKFNDLKKILITKKLKLHSQDYLMFYTKTDVENLDFSNIKIVKSEKDLKIFLDTANKCYYKNDPQGPYGELDDFINTAKRGWHNLYSKGKIEFYLAYKNNIPVAISVLSTSNDIGYISLVGSIKDVRGQGFGKLITLYSVKRSIELQNKYHCLATEKGHYPYEFYKKLGFKTKYKMNIFAK